MIIFPKNNEVEEEIICLDGSTSEIMCHLMDNFLPNLTRGFNESFQQLLMTKGMLMGLGVMSNQLFRVNQWAKERTESLCRMQSLSIK